MPPPRPNVGIVGGKFLGGPQAIRNTGGYIYSKGNLFSGQTGISVENTDGGLFDSHGDKFE